MRIGLFADIHANREALEQCLIHGNAQGIDQYLFLGDFLGYGANPEWVLEIIIRYWKAGAWVVLGNHDAAILRDNEKDIMREEAQLAISWTRLRLKWQHLDFLGKIPFMLEKNIVCYAHANPWEPHTWEYIVDISSAARAFDTTLCIYIFVGHVHQSVLYHQSITGKIKSFIPHHGVPIPLSRNRRWLGLIGSVGQPRDGNPAACYAIHDTKQETLTYYRVPFDAEMSAAKIRAAGLPDWNAARLTLGV